MADETPIKGKAPAFQFYPKDFLGDEKQAVMTLAEVGAYWRLTCRCWLEGSIPNDVGRLARLCGATGPQMAALWPAIAPCFQEGPDGRLIHGRLEKERAKQTRFRNGQSEKANARWHKKTEGSG